MSTEDKDLFDPETGRPLNRENISHDRFDPETGRPLNGNSESVKRFDPETGEPLTGVRPDLFDPETGERISQARGASGQSSIGAQKGISLSSVGEKAAAVLEGKGKILLAVGAAAVAGTVVIGAVAGSGLFKSKKDIVADALTGIVDTIDEGYLERTFGIKELQEMARSGSVSMGGSLSMDEIPGLGMPSFETGLIFSRDPGKEAVRLEGTVGVGGMDYGTLTLYMDDKEIAAAAPEFTDSVLVMNYRDNFGERICDSELGSMLWAGEEEADDVGRILGRVNEALTGKKEYFNFGDMYERYKKATKATDTLKDAMEVKRVESKKFTVNGKKQKCKGYEVTIPSEALADFVKSAGKYFTSDETIEENELDLLRDILTLAYEAANSSSHNSARSYAEQEVEALLDDIKDGSYEIADLLDDYVEDLELVLYVDKKGNAARLEAATEVQAYGSCEISAEFDFAGGKIPTRDMSGIITLEEGGSRRELEFTKKEEEDRSGWNSQIEMELREGSQRSVLSLTAEHDKKSGDFSLGGEVEEYGTRSSVEIGGIVLDHKKGKSLSLEIDTLEVDGAYNSFGADFALSLFIEPLSGKLQMPSGKMFDVLKATEDDWNDLGEEVQDKAREFINVLS